MFDYFISIFASFMVMVLIFFISSNAITTRNCKLRALIYFLITLILLLGALFGYFYDASSLEELVLVNYLIFPGTILVVGSFLIINNLIKAKKHHHHLRGYRHRQVNDIEQYMYIVYKVDGKYLLKKDDDKYRGEVIKFYRNIYFHDEMIKKVIEKYDLKVIKTKLIGEVMQVKKKKMQYFCYYVELNEINIDGFIEIDQYDIININAEEFDKQIILRIVIGNEFNIKV